MADVDDSIQRARFAGLAWAAVALAITTAGLLGLFVATASARVAVPGVALGGVPLISPPFPPGSGEPELGVPPGRFIVRGTVAVGIVPGDGVIVASEQGPIWLRPVGPGLDQLLSAVEVLDYGKVRLHTRDPRALNLVRWRVDMPGKVDLLQRDDGSVLISSDGERAGVIRAQATDQAATPCLVPRIPLGEDQVLPIDPAELLCDGVLRLDDVDGTIDIENLGGLQPAICNIFAFPPPSGECTQVDPLDVGLNAPADNPAATTNVKASTRAIGRCSGLIHDPEFDRSAIRTSGFETCTNSVTRKLSISIERRRKFLFISYWGKFAIVSGAPNGTQFAVTTPVQGGSAKPTFPRLAVLPASTTGVNGGGITRGVLVTSSRVNVRLIDRFSYLDPNLPCDQPEIATWNLVKLSTLDETGTGSAAQRRLARTNRGVYLWAPRRVGDETTPAVPQPRLSPPVHACTTTTPPP